MIRGMTGQASCRFSTDLFDVEMEIRSVNSRYFEFRIKTPPQYALLEIDARKIVSQRLSRGKIDVHLNIKEKGIYPDIVLINKDLAGFYYKEGKALAESLGMSSAMSLRELLSLPQVLYSEFSNINEELVVLILEKLNELINQILPMMIVEGSSTVADINSSLTAIIESVAFIKEKYPVSLEQYKTNLKHRVLEIVSVKPSDERLAIEIELFASRTAINEEIVRLKNHVSVMQGILLDTQNESSKKLDFIAQEMNREVNTIASKSSDFSIIEHSIILKSEIEKMREQFRNIV